MGVLGFLFFLTVSTPALELNSIRHSPPETGVPKIIYKSTLQGELAIHIHFPPGASLRQRPAIVFFFGGGLHGGNVDQFTIQADYFARRGMVAARADYRVGLKQGNTAAMSVEDGKSAIRWIRRNAESLGIDPNRIAAAGSSEGGHVAACTVTADGFEAVAEDSAISVKPNVLILFNPALNLWTSEMIKTLGSAGMAKLLSPNLHLSREMPPTLLLYGSADPLLAQGQQFMASAKEIGFPAELYTVDGVGHVFFNQSYWQNHTRARVDQFLSKYGYTTGESAEIPKTQTLVPSPQRSTNSTREKQIQRTGAFQTTFKEHSPLSSLGELARRMNVKLKRGENPGHQYDLAKESFYVYVPETYQPHTQFGLIVWISPGNDGAIHPAGWRELMDQYHLIWVGADNSGNEMDIYTRRVPLALDAAYNMQKLYTIDPKRVYVAGLSGGGRVSSMTAMHHPDVYAGGIFMIGVNYWKRMEAPSKKGYYWPVSFAKPDANHLSHAGNEGRYVFLTGDFDSNREQTYHYYEYGYKQYLKNALYIQVPQMGHESPPAEWFAKAIEFLDRK